MTLSSGAFWSSIIRGTNSFRARLRSFKSFPVRNLIFAATRFLSWRNLGRSSENTEQSKSSIPWTKVQLLKLSAIKQHNWHPSVFSILCASIKEALILGTITSSLYWHQHCVGPVQVKIECKSSTIFSYSSNSTEWNYLTGDLISFYEVPVSCFKDLLMLALRLLCLLSVLPDEYEASLLIFCLRI